MSVFLSTAPLRAVRAVGRVAGGTPAHGLRTVTRVAAPAGGRVAGHVCLRSQPPAALHCRTMSASAGAKLKMLGGSEHALKPQGFRAGAEVSRLVVQLQVCQSIFCGC
jgi:hypothetical protein